MNSADFLVIGGGIAGLSAASRLVQHGKVVVLEAEDALGYHSTGRSVTFSHYGIGGEAVRALTRHSRDFFLEPPEGFCPAPLCRPAVALFTATAEMVEELDRLHEQMSRFSDSIAWADVARMKALFPPVRTGRGGAVKAVEDSSGLRLDADALLQAYARSVRSAGGSVALGQRVVSIRRNGAWEVVTERDERWAAPILVNAAGAWADAVARLAGVAPLGLAPKRRTIIVVDPPPGADVSDWAFLKTAVDDFYMLPESGRLLASPVDEISADPCDASPEELDIAIAAAKVEEYTTLEVKRIAHSWAGLRSFVADRVPTAGFADGAPGFFWLAGQGGYRLQTAPAMAEITEALITGARWPNRLFEDGLEPEKILPDRFKRATN